jgi:hypothetical protein
MRFLIDECLHESLVGVAHDAGFEATHINHLGFSASRTGHTRAERCACTTTSAIRGGIRMRTSPGAGR